MTRIVLTTAVMLLAMGSAFAGSDHFDANKINNANQSTVGVDNPFTGSVGKRDVAKPNVDTNITTGAPGSKAWPTPGQGIWGH